MLSQFVIVCLFVDTSLHVCVCCLSAFSWVCLFVGLCLTVCLSVCLDVCLSVCLSLFLCVRPSVCAPACLCVCLSVVWSILWPRNPVARLDTGLKPCGCQRKTHSTSQETKSDNIRSVGICMYTPCAPSNVGKYKRFLLYCLLCW